MHRGYLFAGALFGAIAVALGAFGAHALKTMVAPEMVNSFDTGVRYQMYHAFALLVVGIMYERIPVKMMRWSAIAFIIGIVLFSGSLYLLTALRVAGTVGLDGVGIVTPFGGIFLILGWCFLLLSVVKKKD